MNLQKVTVLTVGVGLITSGILWLVGIGMATQIPTVAAREIFYFSLLVGVGVPFAALVLNSVAGLLGRRSKNR
jgi:hypothetical protein